MSRSRKFLALPAHDRVLLLEACWNLAWALVCLRLVPFRWIARRMRVCRTEPPRSDLSMDQIRMAQRIRWTIRMAARHIPWRAVCLPQSLAAKTMLKRRGIPATLYFGVRRSPDSLPGFEAHAWVSAGVLEVTPSQGPGEFVVVAMFG